MYKTLTSSHSASIHSTFVVPAYQQFTETPSVTETPLTTTHDLLSTIRLDSLVIMSAIEADALEEEYHHQKIQQIQQELSQLKQYYLKAIPLFYHDDSDYAA